MSERLLNPLGSAGTRTLADRLRLAPGFHVAQTSANPWAYGEVTCRF